MSGLVVDRRQLQRRARAPAGPRRDDDLRLARPARPAAGLPRAHGLELHLGLSHDSDFNADFGVSAGESATHAPAAPRPQANELALLKLLTEQPTASENLPLITTLNAASTGTDLEGYFSGGHDVSTFAREGGTVYHCYSSYARGTDFLMGYYAILDRAPKGRDEGDQPMSWLRRRDEYDNR